MRNLLQVWMTIVAAAAAAGCSSGPEAAVDGGSDQAAHHHDAASGVDTDGPTPDVDAARDLGEEGWNPEDYFQRSSIGPVPEYEQREGDPQRGYDILVNEGYISCGIPARLFDQYFAPLVRDVPRLPNRRAINEDLPFDRTRFTRDGIELVSTNCLSCHANINPATGELFIGLGLEGDYTSDLAWAAELGAGLVDETNEREVEEYDRFLKRVMAVSPYVRMSTVGVNPADNLAGVLTAHRNPDTWEWLDEPWYEIPDVDPVPLSVPPLWNVDEKNALYYTSVGRGDHSRFMMAAALLCTDSLEEARKIDEWFVHVRAYLETLEPPEYPQAVEPELAAAGEAVFEETCARCHGRYGEDEVYPNLVVSLEEVGTDPVLAESAVLVAEEAVAWLNRSFFGEVSIVASAPGYIAPPLDGVWATAPYLHNASVPTLAALLDSESRPRYWSRANAGYDFEEVGLRYVESSYGKDGAETDSERRAIYDTREWGYDNGGHTFGDELSEDERRAVLEYLKTL